MTRADRVSGRAGALRPHLMAIAAVCAITAVIYLRLLRAPFLPWDDDVNISQNPFYSGLSPWPLWRQPYFGLYVPVTSTIWGAIYKIGGGAAWPFRLTNVVLHLGNTLLVWQLTRAAMRRLLLAAHEPIAVIAAAVFALHPMQVGAVAWLSGGRDLLATMFGLLATLVYFRPGRRWYVIATILFVASLLSKPSGAGIPLAIIAFAALFERARLADTIRGMALWCALVLVVAIGTSVMQTDMAAVTVPVIRRPLVAVDAIGFYLLKLVWPVRLSVDYGRTPDWLFGHLRAAGLTTLTAAVALCAIVWAISRRGRAYALPLLWLLLLAPVLGVMPFAFQRISTVADHYAYLPMAGLALCVAVWLSQIRSRRPAAMMIAVAFIGALAWASFARLPAWSSGDALFSDALSKNPRSWPALDNLGRAACYRGEFDEGLRMIDRSLTIRPSDETALAGRAFCLYGAHRFIETVDIRRRLLDSTVQFNLERNDRAAGSLSNSIAGAYFAAGDLGDGWPFLCQAISVQPLDQDLQSNAADIRRRFGERGLTPRCPGRMPWKTFAQFVNRLGPD